jgi:hypothetical protein
MKVTLKQVGKAEDDTPCYKIVAFHDCSYIYVPHDDRKRRVGDILNEGQVDRLVLDSEASIIILAA